MTQRARARFNRATRFGVIAMAVVVLMLMNGHRPLGQAPAGNAVDFDSTAPSDYITMGLAPSLNATNFTVELWFKREGNGINTTTGTLGLAAAVPLVAKGRGEAENSNVDMNYFLGLSNSGGQYFLAADFEEGAGQVSP